MEAKEVLFKNTTDVNESCKGDFIQFIWLGYNKYKYWTIMILVVINLLLLGVCRIINQIRIYGKITTSSVAFLVVYLLIFFIVLWLPNRKGKSNANIVYNYEFFDEYMQISSQLATEKILYTNTNIIKSVCNTEKYIYFMLSGATGFIIDKSGFDSYDEGAFKSYIENKFNDKYIDFTDKKNKKQYKKIFKVSDIFKCLFIVYAVTIFLCIIFD